MAAALVGFASDPGPVIQQSEVSADACGGNASPPTTVNFVAMLGLLTLGD